MAKKLNLPKKKPTAAPAAAPAQPATPTPADPAQGQDTSQIAPRDDRVLLRRLDASHEANAVVDELVPSRRNELEITDVLNHYLPGNLFTPKFDGLWTDAGTVTSLLRAAELAEQESRSGRLAGPPARPTA